MFLILKTEKKNKINWDVHDLMMSCNQLISKLTTTPLDEKTMMIARPHQRYNMECRKGGCSL